MWIWIVRVAKSPLTRQAVVAVLAIVVEHLSSKGKKGSGPQIGRYQDSASVIRRQGW